MLEARKLYETKSDLNNESRVAQIIEQRLNLKLFKLPIRYSIDYAATDPQSGVVQSWLEIKCRNIPSFSEMTYEYLIVSLYKIANGLHYAGITHKLFFMFYSFLDHSIYNVEISKDFIKEDADVRIKGRTDRGDSQDMEPVLCIPKDRLNKFY